MIYNILREKAENNKIYKKIRCKIGMINQKEIGAIVLISLIIAASMSIFKIGVFLGILISMLIVIVINSIAKKIAAFYLESEIEIKPWQIQRYGLNKRGKTKTPLFTGVFLTITLSTFS